MYKCKSCGRQFVGGKRRDQSQIITDYVEGKQTLSQLAAKYGVETAGASDVEKMQKFMTAFMNAAFSKTENGVKIN